jgi:hypothetical protein
MRAPAACNIRQFHLDAALLYEAISTRDVKFWEPATFFPSTGGFQTIELVADSGSVRDGFWNWL